MTAASCPLVTAACSSALRSTSQATTAFPGKTSISSASGGANAPDHPENFGDLEREVTELRANLEAARNNLYFAVRCPAVGGWINAWKSTSRQGIPAPRGVWFARLVAAPRAACPAPAAPAPRRLARRCGAGLSTHLRRPLRVCAFTPARARRRERDGDAAPMSTRLPLLVLACTLLQQSTSHSPG